MSTSADFDFLMGDWTVAHRRLKHRMVGSNEWQEFPGTLSCRKVLGGMGNSDENHLELPGDPYHAMTVRLFDPKEAQWAIWWFDGRSPGLLDPPVKGRFVDGLGTFLTNDNFQGIPIVVRFVWDVREADAPRWEQAFSKDGGTSWEVNWVMSFRRAG